jgi:TctA family transporter
MKKFFKTLAIILGLLVYLFIGILVLIVSFDGGLLEPFFDVIWSSIKSLIKREISFKELLKEIKKSFKEVIDDLKD